MEKDIKLGAEGDLDLKFVGGQLVVTFTYGGASGSASVQVTQSPKYFLEKLKGVLPANVFVDGAIDAVEAGLLLVP